MMQYQFWKMHGLGNDFVIIDCTDGRVIDIESIISISNRKTGVGCDQVVLIRSINCDNYDVNIYNADGSTATACGNAMRCLGLLAQRDITVNISQRKIHILYKDPKHITAVMGKASYIWHEIPLYCAVEDIMNIPVCDNIIGAAVNVGNPHLVIFDEVQAMSDVYDKITQSGLFPIGVNVTFAKSVNGDSNSFKIITYERGVGRTLACGTAACATACIALKRNISNNHAINIIMDGGIVNVYIDENGIISQKGEATLVASGVLYA